MRWPWWAWILLVLPWTIILSMLGYVVWTFWPRPEPPKPAVTVPHDTYQKLLKLKEKGKR